MKHETKIKVGQRFRSMGAEIRIMAIVDNYIMMRIKGCIPFVQSVKAFEARNLPLVEKNKK